VRNDVRYSKFIPVGWEGLSLVAVTAVVLAAYWRTKPPFYNSPPSIDPWLYTALFVNFHKIYHLFSATYYPSRLPWVIPGVLANTVFSPRDAYFALHGTFFLAGPVFLYLLARSHLGRLPALVAYATLLGSQMWWDANRWDYWEGPITAYVAAAFFFGLTRRTGRRRMVMLAASGFFMAAAVATNLFSIILAAAFLVMYAVLWAESDRVAFFRRVLRDGWAFAGGFVLLFVACGIFARANGGAFWFIGPQVRAARTIDPALYKQAAHLWIGRESRLLVPLFLLAACAILLPFAPRSHARRFAAATAASLAFVAVVLVVWEFPLGGYFLEYTYYFSPLLTGLVICLAALVAAVLQGLGNRLWVRAAVLISSTAAVVGPLLWIYVPDALSRVAEPGVRTTGVIMGVALGVALLAVAVRRVPCASVLGAAAIAAMVFAASYGLDASYGVYINGTTDRFSRPVFDLGIGLVDYLNSRIPDRELPAFWYDRSNLQGGYVGIQSLYYFSYSYIGIELPKVDADLHQRMKLFKPQHLVMLCPDRACSNGPAVLRRAGYGLRSDDSRLLRAEGQHMWVRIFQVTKLAPS
jgi:hypothetical protein